MVLSAGVIAVSHLNEGEQRTAYIYSDDKLIDTIDLGSVEDEYFFRVENSDGTGFNTVTVRPGEIGVTDASCPDKVCMHTGFIHSSALPIVCLPNKIVIKISENENNGIDTVTQ